MRRAANFKTDGQYDVPKIFALTQLMWPEALLTDQEERPGLYQDVVDRLECRHFTIWETAGSILDNEREDAYDNGVLEFRLFDDNVVVSSWPRQDAAVDGIMMMLTIYLKWKPYHTTPEAI
jgi:hypothetical protein